MLVKVNAFSLKELHVVDPGWCVTPKQLITEFSQVFNIFINLRKVAGTLEGVAELEQKRIVFSDPAAVAAPESPPVSENSVDSPGTVISAAAGPEAANHITEYKEYYHARTSHGNTSTVDMVALWTLEYPNAQTIKGAHFITIRLESNTGDVSGEKYPVQIIATCPNEVRHNFTAEP